MNRDLCISICCVKVYNSLEHFKHSFDYNIKTIILGNLCPDVQLNKRIIMNRQQ